MEKGKKKLIRDYLMIFIGTGILAVSISSLFDPIGMVTGGSTGVSIIVKSATSGIIEGGIPLWLTNLALNVPVFIIGYRVKGKEFIGRTLVGTMLLSVWLYVLPVINLADGDYVLTAIFGGLLCGAGIGMVLQAKATTGGTDMIAVLLQHKLLPHYSVAQIMQVLDGMIVLTGILVFGIKVGLYAIAAIFVVTQVADALTEGLKSCRVAYIITQEKDLVAQKIMRELERGVTGINAKGMYSQELKCMLYCVVSKKEVVRLKEIVTDIDPKAFIIVSDAREVHGEGFIEHSKM